MKLDDHYPAGVRGVCFFSTALVRTWKDLRLHDSRGSLRSISVEDELARLDLPEHEAALLVERVVEGMRQQPECYSGVDWGTAAFALAVYCRAESALLRSVLELAIAAAASSADSAQDFIHAVMIGPGRKPGMQDLLDYLTGSEVQFLPTEVKALWERVLWLRYAREASGGAVSRAWRTTVGAFWHGLHVGGSSIEEMGRTIARQACLRRMLWTAEHQQQFGVAAAFAAAIGDAAEAERLTAIAGRREQQCSLLLNAGS